MGGDAAPGRIVDGAIAATRHFDLGVVLVGARRQIEAALAGHLGLDRARVRVVDAADVIEMHEAPTAALRRKPNASIKVAADLVANGEAAALFSAGHTGASVMAAYTAFGLVPGGDRPALAVPISTNGRPAGRLSRVASRA